VRATAHIIEITSNFNADHTINEQLASDDARLLTPDI